jgi:ankyrin repeat protein
LHWAALQLDDVTLAMLSSHIFDTDLEDDNGRTPLFLACVEGRDISGKTDIDALKRCLSCLITLQANSDVKDKNNVSALQYLAASWQYDPMKLLLEDKVDPNYVSGKYNFSALHYAANASPLKKAKGEASKVLNSFKDDGDINKPEELNVRTGVITLKTLLEAGAKPNYRDSRGKSALQLIGEQCDQWGSNLSEAVGVLLSYGARLDESAQIAILRSKCPDINFESIIYG